MKTFAKLVPLAVLACFWGGSANAQSLSEALARDCGTRAANYCWDTNGDGYGTPDQCIAIATTLFCPAPPEGETPEEWYGGPRLYGVYRFDDLVHFCSGIINCSSSNH